LAEAEGNSKNFLFTKIEKTSYQRGVHIVFGLTIIHMFVFVFFSAQNSNLSSSHDEAEA
jgi:hypothetical protein